MNSIMAFLMKWQDTFFSWWAKVTKTEYRKYRIEAFNWEFGVNWPMVSFMIALWGLMFVLWLIF